MKLVDSLVFSVMLFSSACMGQEPDTFANHLFEISNYQAAVLEYERLVFYHSSDSSLPYWRFRLGTCKLYLNQYERALAYLSLIPASSTWSDSARLLSAECALHLNRPQLIDSILVKTHLGKALLTRGYAAFMTGNYTASKKTLESMEKGNPYFLQAGAISNIADSIQTFRPKHYFPASVLAIIPGLGHVYTKRYGDAVFSFSVVGFLAATSAYYYHNGATNRAAILGGLAGIFYGGSVYGSLVAVKLHNQGTIERLRKRAERLYWK